MNRVSCGIPELDEHLGGGLLPGTLTAVIGATGVGKTQLGIHYANAGQGQDGRRGALIDFAARGDTQSHDTYAARIYGWEISKTDPAQLQNVAETGPGMFPVDDLLLCHLASLQQPLDLIDDARRRDEWKREFARLTQATIGFLYHHFVRGTRRVVFDGLPPTASRSKEQAYEMIEIVNQRVLKQSAEWVARELYRQHFHRRESEIHKSEYRFEQLTGIACCTSQHSMLTQLIDEPLQAHDFVAEVNTLIYLGRIREGDRLGRALYIAKHRGSECSDALIPFRIGEHGLVFE